MWGFLKRQLKTKTGKAALGTVASIGIAVGTGELEVQAAVTPVVMSVLSMFLRDGEAKKQQERGD